jgi:hypothetical protein
MSCPCGERNERVTGDHEAGPRPGKGQTLSRVGRLPFVFWVGGGMPRVGDRCGDNPVGAALCWWS